MAHDSDSGGTKVSLATHEQRISVLERHDLEQKNTLSELEKFQTESELRFANGQKTMTALDVRIAALEPKQIQPWKYITGGAGIVATIVVVFLTAQMLLLERPTEAVVDAKLDTHEEEGHRELREDVRAIKRNVSAVNKMQKGAAEKLDIVLERLPELPKKRRRER